MEIVLSDPDSDVEECLGIYVTLKKEIAVWNIHSVLRINLAFH